MAPSSAPSTRALDPRMPFSHVVMPTTTARTGGANTKIISNPTMMVERTFQVDRQLDSVGQELGQLAGDESGDDRSQKSSAQLLGQHATDQSRRDAGTVG